MMRELETERLRLRRLTAEDAQTIFDGWASDPEVPKYMTWNAHKDVSETKRILDGWLRHYDEPDCFRYGMELKCTGELIGMIDVVGYREGCPVIGYCSGKRFWGNGYMTEALNAVSDELFSAGYDTLIVEAVKENIGSNRVIRKCGYELVSAEKKQLSDIKPEPVTVNSYRKKRTDL